MSMAEQKRWSIPQSNVAGRASQPVHCIVVVVVDMYYAGRFYRLIYMQLRVFAVLCCLCFCNLLLLCRPLLYSPSPTSYSPESR
jgi:hypothetical protein